MREIARKPILKKNYGSIPHLPNSRLGPGDHSIGAKQAEILTEKARDYKDLVIVQEKLDGANVGVLKMDGRLIPLTRAGYEASTSPMQQFQMFCDWVRENEQVFDSILLEGERIVGEWLVMAHGTRYKLRHEPFVAFDIMYGDARLTYLDFRIRMGEKLPVAKLLHMGQPISVKKVEKMLGVSRPDGTFGYHGALEPVEGAVWRVEREHKVDFLAKFVRHFKEDGKYFNDDHSQLVWNETML